MSENIIQDIEESRKEKLYLSEYIASFWNSEAVRKIQERRRMSEESSAVTEEDFIDLNKKLSDENKSLIDAIKSIRKNDSDKNNNNEGSINLNKLIKDVF